MSFNFNPSSSPPSTPNRSLNNTKSNRFGASNPTTTPAGPPPSSQGSFTPAGRPSPSYLNSSIFGNTSPSRPPSKRKLKPFGSAHISQTSNLRNELRSSPPPHHGGYGFAADAYDQSEDDEEHNSEPDDIVDDGRHDAEDMSEDSGGSQRPDSAISGPYSEDNAQEEMEGDPARGRSFLSQNAKHSYLRGTTGGSFLGQPTEARFKSVAKDLYTRMSYTAITEGGDVIFTTESIMEDLFLDKIGSMDDDMQLDAALAESAAALVAKWDSTNTMDYTSFGDQLSGGIGPSESAHGFTKANFIAQLVLRLQHLTHLPEQAFSTTKQSPESLILDWANAYHTPYPSQLQELRAHRPSPSAHRLYWTMILNSLIRGQVTEVVALLQETDWSHAWRGGDHDDKEATGYSGEVLETVEEAVKTAATSLAMCPAFRGDWNIHNSDWTLFRLHITRVAEELKRFTDGRHTQSAALLNTSLLDTSFQNPDSFSQTARRAESRLPWHIYQNLLTLYNVVLGDPSGIIDNAQDWCEATIGLFVWRDEGKMTRMRASTARKSMMTTFEPENPLQPLHACFHRVLSTEGGFQVDTLNAVELALACYFEGDCESVIAITRKWSCLIASALAELGSYGQWLPTSSGQDLMIMDSLDQDDLELLGLAAQSEKDDGIKDSTLITYARMLAQLEDLTDPNSASPPREGWEVSIALLSRLDSESRADKVVEQVLATLSLETSSTVDKLCRLMNHLGMTRHAEQAADTYADHLAESTFRYGEALWYYALAHKSDKVKDVLDLLISFSLINSSPYPAQVDMDTYLKKIVETPSMALIELAALDFQAADVLHRSLSGYATLRRFYLLRDQEAQQMRQQAAWKQEAVSILLTVITSAGNNIVGGLYDESRGAVVSSDFLLALFGELVPFLQNSDHNLSTAQIHVVLRAIEDLQTIQSRIYTACDEFLTTVMKSAQGLKGSTPADLLQKSISNSTGSFSLVGSSMLASQIQRNISSSGAMKRSDIKRGWDWRKGFTAATKGEDILRVIRLCLAKDLATIWLRQVDKI